MDTNKLIAIEAWIAAIRKGGDPEEWRKLLGLSWEELSENADMTAAAKTMVERHQEEVLNLFPAPLRPYIVLAVSKPAKRQHSTDAGNTVTVGTGSGRGKAYEPKLDRYVWKYKGKTASIRRIDGGWEASYDGNVLGVFSSHTGAIEKIYRVNGVTAALNAVKAAKLREQDAAAGFTD
jgi:hypothetical protein